MSIAESIGEMVDRIQSVCRFGRKPKPVCYIDIETRDVDGSVLALRDYPKKGLEMMLKMDRDKIIFPK